MLSLPLEVMRLRCISLYLYDNLMKNETKHFISNFNRTGTTCILSRYQNSKGRKALFALSVYNALHLQYSCLENTLVAVSLIEYFLNRCNGTE